MGDFPRLMAIVNLDPTSFFSKSVALNRDDLLCRAEECIEAGASILDVGAEPTSLALSQGPQVFDPSAARERLLWAVEILKTSFPQTTLSVDTSDPEAMRQAVALGAGIINDVRAFREAHALTVAASLQVPIVLMHVFHTDPSVNAVSEERPSVEVFNQVYQFLGDRVQACVQAGIEKEEIFVDPGFGAGCFGKSTRQNLFMLRHLADFKGLGCPIVVGFSRKKFTDPTGGRQKPEQRLGGSLATALYAAYAGASILRVHDVRETRDMLMMWRSLNEPD